MSAESKTLRPPGTIAVVCADSLRFTSFVTDLYAVRAPKGSRIVWGIGLEVTRNANVGVDEFLANPEHSWILFLGDDHNFHPTLVERLWDSLAANPHLDAMAALVLRRTPPWDTVAYAGDPRTDTTPLAVGHETGVVEVTAVGNSGLMVRRRVFEAMSKPYFRVGQMDPEHYQEDLEWCERARALGFRFGVDLDTPMGHVTSMCVWPARGPSGKHVVALVGRNGITVPVDPRPTPTDGSVLTNVEESRDA